MDYAFHLHFWTGHQIDPVVWMRVARCLFFFISGLLMLKEPMNCGGRNTSLHRILAAQFLIAALYSYGIAKARMVLLVLDPASLTELDLMVYELVYTGISFALLMRMAYDYYRWKVYPRRCLD